MNGGMLAAGWLVVDLQGSLEHTPTPPLLPFPGPVYNSTAAPRRRVAGGRRHPDPPPGPLPHPPRRVSRPQALLHPSPSGLQFRPTHLVQHRVNEANTKVGMFLKMMTKMPNT